MSGRTTHVVQRAIRSNGTSFLEVSLLTNDRGDTTCRQSGRSCPDQHRKLLEEFSLFLCRLDTVEVVEDSNDRQEFVGRISVVSIRTLPTEAGE